MNILYLHSHDSGCYFHPYGENVHTPNIDHFTKDALLFRHHFCVSPTCSPSRAALLTGSYPMQNGMIGLSHRGFSLTDPQQHLANFLKKQGFCTILSGVQHESGHFNQVDVKASQQLGYQHILTTDFTGDYSSWDAQNVQNAVDFLHHYDQQKPFFLSMGFFATHRPYPPLTSQQQQEQAYRYLSVPPILNDTLENRIDTCQLHNSLTIFDQGIGLIIATLKTLALYDNTIIVLTTDHGLANPFSKCNLNDAGTHVTLILRVPDYPHSHGEVAEALASHLDLFPTFCDLLHYPYPNYLQGKSLLPLLNDHHATIHDHLFAELNFHTSYEPARSIRTSRYRFIQYFDHNWPYINVSNIDNSPAKSLLLQHDLMKQLKPMEQLYDHLYDPMEKNNLVHHPDYQAVYQQLKQQLHQWMKNRHDKIYQSGEYNHYLVNKSSCIEPSIRDKNDQALFLPLL